MPNPVKSSSSPRPTQAVALDLCKAFDRGWYAGLLFIKIIKLLEDLGAVICGICKTVKKKRTNKWIAWYVVRNFRSLHHREYASTVK